MSDFASVIATLHGALTGRRYLQTSNGRQITIEVYNRPLGETIAGLLDDYAIGHLTGARVAAVWVGTLRGVPVEVIHIDVTAFGPSRWAA